MNLLLIYSDCLLFHDFESSINSIAHTKKIVLLNHQTDKILNPLFQQISFGLKKIKLV